MDEQEFIEVFGDAIPRRYATQLLKTFRIRNLRDRRRVRDNLIEDACRDENCPDEVVERLQEIARLDSVIVETAGERATETRSEVFLECLESPELLCALARTLRSCRQLQHDEKTIVRHFLDRAHFWVKYEKGHPVEFNHRFGLVELAVRTFDEFSWQGEGCRLPLSDHAACCKKVAGSETAIGKVGQRWRAALHDYLQNYVKRTVRESAFALAWCGVVLAPIEMYEPLNDPIYRFFFDGLEQVSCDKLDGLREQYPERFFARRLAHRILVKKVDPELRARPDVVAEDKAARKAKHEVAACLAVFGLQGRDERVRAQLRSLLRGNPAAIPSRFNHVHALVDRPTLDETEYAQLKHHLGQLGKVNSHDVQQLVKHFDDPLRDLAEPSERLLGRMNRLLESARTAFARDRATGLRSLDLYVRAPGGRW